MSQFDYASSQPPPGLLAFQIHYIFTPTSLLIGKTFRTPVYYFPNHPSSTSEKTPMANQDNKGKRSAEETINP